MNKKQLKAILIGTVLGDSSLVGKANKYIYMGHSEKEKEYLEWKIGILKSYVNIGVNYNQEGYEQKSGYSAGNRQRIYKAFSTTHHKLTSLYNLIYDGKKKTINKKVLKYFDKLALAALFMDDGCKETVLRNGIRVIKSFKISLGSYQLEEVEELSKHILDVLKIETKVYLEHKKYPCIKISKKEEREKFIALVKPYIHNCLLYKIQV